MVIQEVRRWGAGVGGVILSLIPRNAGQLEGRLKL